jgi:polysaccharide biosynthesis transport protein
MTDAAPVRSPREVHREQPHLLDYVRILLRRKFIVLLVFVVVMAGAVGYLYTVTPVYEAKARLLIEVRGPNAATGEPVDQSEMQQGYYQTHYQLLQSRDLAKKTITSLDLWNHPQFNPPPQSGRFAWADPARARLAAQLQPHWPEAAALIAPQEPTAEAVPDAARVQDRAVTRFLSNLSVNPIQNSRLVELVFHSSDPDVAVMMVNGLARTYIADSLDSRLTTSRETSDWLTEQIEKQRARVEAAEAALQNYRERIGSLSLEDGQNIVVQKLADLNSAVTRAKTERLQREAVYRQARSGGDQAATLDIPAIMANGYVQEQRTALADLQRQQAELAEKLGDRHPEMIKLRLAIQKVEAGIRSAVYDVVESLRRDYESALAHETSLTDALNQQKAEAQSMNRKAVEYAVLAREVESSNESYGSLLERGAKQSAAAGDLRTNNVRIVDMAAEPDAPISPKRKQFLLIALMTAAFLSVSAAFFIEYLDHRVKTPEEIETHLRLASLGTIPRLSRRSRKAFAANRLINHGVPPDFAEAFRGLRTNVLFSSPNGGPCSIVVTSASPREGKTMVASNLAVGLAQAGHQVVLLDADLRRPRVHELFGLALEPGLSDLLSGGERHPREVLQSTKIPNLHAMSAGGHASNSAELVGSNRFAETLEFLEQHFDIVVIDTPPVMAVADAAILAHRTSGVLFVVAADTTSRHAAQTALEQLDRARARFLGAVLNRVDFDLAKYRYAPYARREYLKARTRVRLRLH